MSKSINVLLALKDQFTSPLKKASGNTKEFGRAVKNAENKLNSIKSAAVKTLKGLALLNLAGIGKLKDGIINFSKESIEAAKEKIKIEKLLEENMRRTSNATNEQINAIKEYAGQLQDIGVIGDDVANAGASQLATYGLQADQIKKMMPIINDMVAKEKKFNGTQEDAVAMADIVAKAMNGQVKGLQKFGVTLTAGEIKSLKMMKQNEKLDFINQKLTKTIGGTNKALRETDEGKIVAMTGAWGDMKAELGRELIPYLGEFSKWFHTKIPFIQDLILSIAKKIKEVVEKANPYIEKIKAILGSMFEKVQPAIEIFKNMIDKAVGIATDSISFLIDNWDALSPVIYSVVGGIATYNAIMVIKNNLDLIAYGSMVLLRTATFAYNVLTGKVRIGTLLWATAQHILNTALYANPIGLIIGLITALVAVVWLCYKHWNKIVKFFKNAWSYLSEKIKGFWSALDKNPIGKIFKWFLRLTFPIILLVEHFKTIKEKVIEFWHILKDNLVNAFNSVVEVLSGVFLPIWELLKSAFNFVVNIISSLCSILKGVFIEAWDGVMKVLDAVLHPIETAKKAFSGLIEKLKFWNNESPKDKILNVTENRAVNTTATSTNNSSASNIPRHALGTSYFNGGLTGINEGGRNETAILPAGTKIMSHEQGKSLNKNNKELNITVNILGNFIGEKEHMEKYGEYTANKILAALNNM